MKKERRKEGEREKKKQRSGSPLCINPHTPPSLEDTMFQKHAVLKSGAGQQLLFLTTVHTSIFKET